MARPAPGLLQGSVRKEWFAGSQFFSVPGHLAQAAALQDRAHIRADQANSVVDHIPPAHRVPADILRVRAWEA
jgi:hypothetical protein